MAKPIGVNPQRSGRLIRENNRNLNIADMFVRNLSPFGEFQTASLQSLFEIKSIHPLSVLRDIQTTSGSATITDSGPEYKLATTASANDSAELRTTEKGPYVPGLGALAGIAVRLPASPTGNQEAIWGLSDDNNGYLFGEDSTAVFIARRKGGTDNKVYQSNWNEDSLDGTGPSELTLDLSDGHIFRIVYSWYGYGAIEWQVVISDSKNEQKVITVHRERVKKEVSVKDPNLPITAKVSNGSTASSLELFVAGRNYSIIGRYNPNTRINGDRRFNQGSVGTSLVPTVSIRVKSGRESTPVRMRGFDLITDADLEVVLLLDASLTGASFADPSLTSATETAVESDVSATALSGGEVLWRGLTQASGAGANKESLRNEELLGLNIPPNLTTITLAVRRISGTGATVSSCFRVKEEW